MKRINFILDGNEYIASFNNDGDVETVYSMNESRFLNYDNDRGVRERPGVWTAAYTMAEI